MKPQKTIETIADDSRIITPRDSGHIDELLSENPRSIVLLTGDGCGLCTPFLDLINAYKGNFQEILDQFDLKALFVKYANT